MPPLTFAKQTAATLKIAFDAQCAISGYGDEWAAFKAHDAGIQWPHDLELIWQRYIYYLHVYYVMRDGPSGVLGNYPKITKINNEWG